MPKNFLSKQLDTNSLADEAHQPIGQPLLLVVVIVNLSLGSVAFGMVRSHPIVPTADPAEDAERKQQRVCSDISRDLGAN